MTASLDLGDNYQIEENSNGNLVVRDSTGTVVLKHEDGADFSLGAALQLGDLVDGSTGDTVYDGSTETLGNGTQDADLQSLKTDEATVNEQYAKIFATSQQSIASSSPTAEEYDSVKEDNNPGDVLLVDTANNKIRIQQPGQYLLISRAGFLSATDNTRYIHRIRFKGGKVDEDENPGSGSNRNYLNCQTVEGISSGDVPGDITTEIFQDSGSAQNTVAGKSASHLEVVRLG